MTTKKKSGGGRLAALVSEARRQRRQREQGYRDRALKLLPHVCAHCGREFSGKKLRELTVHHKDHNHDNNPPDGSNWELLCIYCHDNEHSRQQVADWYDSEEDQQPSEESLPHRPFAALKDLIKKNNSEA